MYSRWKWLYSSLYAAKESELIEAVNNFTSDEIEHYGRSSSLIKINWLSFDDLEANVDNMNAEKQSCLRALFDERYHYTEGGQKNSTKYFGNTLISLMADFEYGTLMCQCGTKGIGVTSKKKPCSKRIYCDRCANRKRRFIHCKYSDSYKPSTPSYLITLTLEKKVKFIEGNYEQVVHDWNKLNAYVDLMYKNKLIIGGLRSEELSIDQLNPVAVVNPHLHVLCQGVADLKSHVFEGLKVDVKKIKDKAHWDTSLNYMYKPMNLFATYAREWNAHDGERINRNLRETLGAYKNVALNRNQSRAFGSFHALSKKCEDECIKTVKRTKKSLQKPKEKINYPQPSMQNSMIPINSTIPTKKFELIKSALNELPITQPIAPPPPQEEEKKPWYKSPLALGAGALAGGAALYGAGKYYHGGNNIVNNTFGAGVDKYLVNPIKNYFDPPKRKITPLPRPNLPKINPASMTLQEGQVLAADPRYVKLQAELMNSDYEMRNYADRLRYALDENNRLGTPFEGASTENIQSLLKVVDGRSTPFVNLPPQVFKNFIRSVGGKDVYDPAHKAILNEINADKFALWLNQHPEQLKGFEADLERFRKPFDIYSKADLGLTAAGIVSPLIKGRVGQAISTASNAAAKLAPVTSVAAGALGGHDFARDTGGGNVHIPGIGEIGFSRDAAHSGAGAILPFLGGIAGRAAIGSRGGLPGMIAASLAYPIADATVRNSSNLAASQFSDANRIASLMNQFNAARDQLQRHNNPLPLEALKSTELFKHYTDKPNAMRAYQGEIPKLTQIDDNSLAQLMALKNSNNVIDIANSSMKQLIERGKAALGPNIRQGQPNLRF